VCDLRFRGRPLDLHARFNVVCNNYRAAGGGGYPHLAAAEVVWRSSAEVTDLIGEYLTGVEEWQPTVDGNWWIAPTSLAEAVSTAGGGR
jgi:2',3'-cyclic-nucleotide 2'-phosphodiesterase/3'-nucleotidase